MAGGIRDSEIKAVAKLASEGNYDAAILQLRALKAAAKDVSPEMANMSKATSQTRLEVERMAPSLRNVETEITNFRKRVAETRQELENAGVKGKVLEATLLAMARDMPQIGNIWSMFTRTLMSVGTNADQAAEAATRLTEGLVKSSTQVEKTASNWQQLSAMFSKVGGAAIPVLIGALVAIVAALGPVIFMTGAWLIVLGAATVGMVAFVAASALAVGVIVALGAGVALLADNYFTTADKAATQLTKAETALTAAQRAHETALNGLEKAQNTYNAHATPNNAIALEQAHQNVAFAAMKEQTAMNNLAAAQQLVAITGQNVVDPLGAIEEHLKSVALLLGVQAYPMLIKMASAADQLVEPLGRAGSALMSWFGDRLDLALQMAGMAFSNMVGPIQDLSRGIGNFTDRVLIRLLGTWSDIWPALARFGVAAILGLLDNLIRLGDWFAENWPKMRGVVMAGFDLMGRAAQRFGSVMAVIVAWIVAHWKDITGVVSHEGETIGRIFSFLGEGANMARILWDLAALALSHVMPMIVGLLKLIAQHSDGLRYILIGLGIVLAVLGASFLMTIVTLALLVAAVLAVIAVIVIVVEWIVKQRNAIWEWIKTIALVIAAIGQWINEHLRQVPIMGFVISLIAGLVDAIIWLVRHWNVLSGVVGAVMSFIGSIVRDIVGAVGASFSFMGTSIRWIGDQFSWLGGHVKNMTDWMGQSARDVEGAFGWAFSQIGGHVHDGLWWAAHIADNFDSMVNNLLGWAGVPRLPTNLEYFARGGIVDRPTAGVFGEAGPEALIPLGAGAGPGAVDIWKRAGQMLGVLGGSSATRGFGGADTTPGHWGGQCIAEGTLIAVEHGELPIENVQVGDRVWTRQGLKLVTWAGLTRPSASVLEIDLGDAKLTCTPDHRLLCPSPGSPLAGAGAALATKAAGSSNDPSVVEVVGMPVRATRLVNLGLGVPDHLQRPVGHLTSPTSEVGPKCHQDGPDVQRAVGLPPVHAQVGMGTGVELVAVPAADHLCEVIHHVGVRHPESQSDLALLDAVGESDMALTFEEASRPGDFEWIPAEQVRVGDVLLRFDGAYFTAVRVHGIRVAPRTDAYDLTVEDAHEFVAAGVVVHNCVVFVEAVTGHHFPVDMASQMCNMVNTMSPAPGEIFVSDLGMFGHTGFVIGHGKVLDSNWGLDEMIQIHNLSDIPSICGYIKGITPGNLPHSMWDVTGMMKDLVGRAMGGRGGWSGGIALHLLDSIIDGVGSRFDSGGIWPSGTLGANFSGRPEYVFTEAQMRAGGGHAHEVHVYLDGQELSQGMRHHIGPVLQKEFQARTGWRGRG